jgi:hypothetical protein
MFVTFSRYTSKVRLGYSYAVKMEIASFAETFAYMYQIVLCNISENRNLAVVLLTPSD